MILFILCLGWASFGNGLGTFSGRFSPSNQSLIKDNVPILHDKAEGGGGGERSGVIIMYFKDLARLC